jgi:hypothetical protein
MLENWLESLLGKLQFSELEIAGMAACLAGYKGDFLAFPGW